MFTLFFIFRKSKPDRKHLSPKSLRFSLRAPSAPTPALSGAAKVLI
jgi:hypothetical protein